MCIYVGSRTYTFRNFRPFKLPSFLSYPDLINIKRVLCSTKNFGQFGQFPTKIYQKISVTSAGFSLQSFIWW